MATRFYLPSGGNAAAEPVIGTEWEHSNAVRRPMNPTKTSSASATTAYAPDAADDLTDGDAMIVQFVSTPLAAQTIAAQTVSLAILAAEDDADNNLFVTWKLYLCSQDGLTIKDTILAIRRDGTEV